jgi:ATP-dependent helicase/DNAse subunit B
MPRGGETRLSVFFALFPRFRLRTRRGVGRRNYHRPVGLSLIVGPANAGKVELLLDRYVAAIDRDPYLIVPGRPDVDRVERELLARCDGLLGGAIGTFDDLFERIAAGDPGRRRLATDAQRTLAVRRALATTELNGLGRSARFGGFADSLAATLGELESGLVEPADLEDDLARLYSAYRGELDRLELWDRDVQRRRAAERLGRDFEAWHDEPVFAYGFEDLTAAQWALLEALARRAEVCVSLPYEPGRVAFASLRRTADDLARLADGGIEELPPAEGPRAHARALAYLERSLFEGPGPDPPELEGTIRFFEGAGVRGVLELVGEELLELIRGGTPADRIAVVCPSLDRWRPTLETALATLGVPYAIEDRLRLGQTPFGHALLSLLRFAWLDGERKELFAFLRSPFSGLSRASVDFVEGRLRGRAIDTPARVEEEAERLRGAPLPVLGELREAESPLMGTRRLLETMLRASYGLEAPPVGDHPRDDLRAFDAALRLLDELDAWAALGEEVGPETLVAALERATVRGASAGEPGQVAVLDLMRARTRRFDVTFVLGLEEGSLPRRGHGSPFLDDDRRRALGRRLERPDEVARDRYLFYTACTRATDRLYLVREAASDEGSPREASPFWDEVVSLFDADDVSRWTRRRALSALTWPLEAAPSERERLRAVAQLAVTEPDTAAALAEANDWSRRLRRALIAFERPTLLRNPAVRAWFGARTVFSATELERFADCSSAWLFERVVDPKTIDAEADAMLRGQVAHQTLFRFYSGLPKEVGTDRVEEARVEEAVGFLRRCLDDALRGGVRLELSGLEAAELEQTLWRDLEQFVRDEARSELQLVPRRLEVGFGSERSAPELQRGLELEPGIHLSGKIDRIDVDPFSARGIVQDYKSGKTVHSAHAIDTELRLQIPLYMLVLRDLVGIEPLGGLYRALAGQRSARGMLRTEAEEDVPGFSKRDYLNEEEFWGQIETARERAADYTRRIRAGDVRHDPKGGECPAWCDLWTMCRVPKP